MNTIFRNLAEKGKHLRRSLTDLCFPSRCLNCNQELLHSRVLFCHDCFEKIEFIEEPFCPCCGSVFSVGKNHICGECLQNKWFFTRARSLVIYNETVGQSILAFKFGGKKEALKTFQLFKNLSVMAEDIVEADFIFPVPLHEKRLRQRGFNQASLLAFSFFPQEKNKIKNTILFRKRETIAQTGLDGSLRRKNIKNAFWVKDPEKIQGKNIILIDDVFTTGTTVNECARVLVKAGAKRVDVLTLARAER